MNSARNEPAEGGEPNRWAMTRKVRFGRRPLTPEEVQIGALLYPERFSRPKTRGDCASFERPCPFVGCRHHLYLEVSAAGGAKLHGCEPWDMAASCALDVAELGGQSLEQIAGHLGVTRQRAQQIESHARMKFARAARRRPGVFDV